MEHGRTFIGVGEVFCLNVCKCFCLNVVIIDERNWFCLPPFFSSHKQCELSVDGSAALQEGEAGKPVKACVLCRGSAY